MSDDTQPVSGPSAEEIASSVPDFSPDLEEINPLDDSPKDEPKKEEEKKEEEKKEEVQKLLRKFKLKVDGQEIEEEIDLNNEEALIKELQLAKAAKKRMAEAQEAKRKAYEIMQSIDQDPANLLKRLGPKGYELAEQMLIEKMQDEMLTPEQKQLKQMERELAKYKEQEKLIKEQEEAQRQQALEAQQAEHYQKTIIEALEKSGLPKTPDAVKRMAFLLHKNLDLGLDLTATELAEEAKKEYRMSIQQLAKDATPEQLINLLDPEILKKLRKYDTDQFKAKNKFTNLKTASQSHALPPVSRERGYQTLDEWQEELNARMKKR